MGLDKRLGTIEVGKPADLAIYNGHPLNGFFRCEMTVIDGEIVFVRERRQTRCYERYRKRLQEVRAKEAKNSVPTGR